MKNSEEWSNGFDTLVSSYRRFRDYDKREPLDTIEFDEYEKSLYLTKAQEELVISLYTGKNVFGESFEQTEELRRYLSSLIKEATIPFVDSMDDSSEEDYSPTSATVDLGLSPYTVTLPSDLWFITYESVTANGNGLCDGKVVLDIMPVTQDEYHKVKRDPFRGANGRRALRLDFSGNKVNIISRYPLDSYYVRYLKKIRPIVLVDLPNDLQVDGEHNESLCELHEGLHQKILELAVHTALQSKGLIQNSNNRDSNAH